MTTLILLLFIGNISSIDLPTVRNLYAKSPSDEASCEKLMKALSSYTEKNNPLLAGYKAAATMIMAEHVFNPFSKLSYFNKGKKMLERAIAADPVNIELRYLRYSIQVGAPSFLGYTGNKAADKTVLQNNLQLITDKQLKEMITLILKRN